MLKNAVKLKSFCHFWTGGLLKKLSLITILCLVSVSSFADELDSVSLIVPVSYDLKPSSTQNFKSKITVGIGDIINTNVVTEVKKKVEPFKAALSNYFKNPGELDSFVEKVSNEGKSTIVGDNLTDAKLIKFYEHLGNKLIGGIADKILNAEGVKDSDRRDLWVKKILAPFNTCISNSKNSQYDASHCMDALTSGLVPNIGNGLVYELSRSNLGNSLPDKLRPGFYSEQVNSYKGCMKQTESSSTDVKNCALSAMKSGVIKITDLKLTSTINGAASSQTASKSIKQAVFPDFAICSGKVGTDKTSKVNLSTQFTDCIDGLVRSTGSLLVQDKIGNTSAIKTNFSKAEISELITEKVQNFKSCIDELKKNDDRKNGMLDTGKCENSITNDITYKVVVKSLVQTANSSFKTDPQLAKDTGKEGKHLLDQCWDNKQNETDKESCLRKTIISFGQKIAAIKLDKSIPDDLKIKEDLTYPSLKNLADCFKEKLPASISKASNLSASTDFCSNKLTRDVAFQVARESVRQKAEEKKVSPEVIDQLLKTYVDQKFMTCIGAPLTDELLNNCSAELKKNVTMAVASIQIRSNADGKVSPEETENLVNNLVNQKFNACAGNNPTDASLNSCTGDLTKAATKSIILSYEKKSIKDQLNADSVPVELKPVEETFVACMDKPYPAEELSKGIDECTKQFAIEFARALGELKLTTLMKSVLGTEGYSSQKKNIDEIIAKYDSCLNDLEQYKMEDDLLGKLTICTDGLQRRGVNFVSSSLNTWMSSEDKDAATEMVKLEFASFIPCLSALMPTSPYTPNLDQNVESVLKPVALLISQYIEYSPENAKQSLEEVIKKLSTDLKDVASNPTSKKELVNLLYKNGALDQFLKSMVRGQVKEGLEKLPESELPKNLRDLLLKKENFDSIFATKEGQKIKDLVMEKILTPLLVDQTSMKSPAITAGMDVVKDQVTKLLVYSPSFGEQIVKTSIQNKINDMNIMVRFFAKALYGRNSLNWEKVRATPNGKAAEAYIEDNYLLPKVRGQKLSANEEKKILAEAEKLVKDAVKSYD